MDEDLARNAASPPLAVRVREACRLTGIGRSKLYELIAAGEIRIIKVGSITLIPLAGLQQFLEQRTP
jgi:excisionase family DNA binding protein